MEIYIAIGAALLVALVFVATVDMAFSVLSDISLRRLTVESETNPRPRGVAFLREILDNRPLYRFAVSSTIQSILIGFTILTTIAVLDFTYETPRVAVVALLIALMATVICRQIIPRVIVRRDPEGALLLLLPAIKPLYRLISFLAAPFASFIRQRDQSKLDNTVTPDSGDEKDEDHSDDIHALMEVGEAEGLIEEKDRELIESMVEFSETRAGEIMTPRTEIVALPVEATVRAARDIIVEQKYSRLPVYRDSIDNIEGVIYVRDLLQAWAQGKEDQRIEEILRPAFFVPETKTASELLKDMQTNHVQLATVIDEYGGVAGLVTVEDIVEEIVGEIEDEDIEEEEIIEIVEGEGGYYDVLGSTDIDKIERLFEIDIEAGEFSTLAGLVTSEAGYVPKPGEVLEMRGLSIEILKADEKKLFLLRLRRSLADSENSRTSD